MSLKLRFVCLTGLIFLLACTTTYAIPVFQSVPVTDGTDGSDGSPLGGSFGQDYWGVISAGPMIGPNSISSQLATPPSAGDLAGRDIDSAPNNALPKTATWTLTLPAGTLSVDSIRFDGFLAAFDGQQDGWGSPAGSLKYEVKVNGAAVVTNEYLPIPAAGAANNAALGLNGTIPAVTQDGNTAVSLGPTGSFSGSPLVELLFTANGGGSPQDFWTRGTLSANAVVVPEPSSALMLLLVSVVGIIGRFGWMRFRAQA